jgi:hypothetical protein
MAVASGVVVPVIAWGDKIVFDGKRFGPHWHHAAIWFRMYGLRRAVKLNKIEQVDTVTAGSFRRGGRVRFMHRTSIYGNGPAIVFSGAGKKIPYDGPGTVSRISSLTFWIANLWICEIIWRSRTK